MTQLFKSIAASGLLLMSFFATAALPALDSVLQKGFPTEVTALTRTTDALYQEYESQQSVASLVFYAYGMLRLADHYKAVNDFVNASEYAKLGFFWLDEAVDSHEGDMRLHYLRARVDAWLPAELGRCVVTLHDTELMAQHKDAFSAALRRTIPLMRYRALLNCNEQAQAGALLSEIKKDDAASAQLSLNAQEAPAWSIDEITQVVIPLMKGE